MSQSDATYRVQSDGSALFRVHAEGPFARFTRPEFRAEGITYDIPTVSAVDHIVGCFLWKPEIRWQVHQIEALRPIRYMSMMVNETVNRAGRPTEAEMAGEAPPGVLDITESEQRAQRRSLLLRDPAYRFTVSLHLIERGPTSALIKYAEMFVRRITRGQCFKVPCFGIREYTCDVRLARPDDPPPIPDDRFLGLMPLTTTWEAGLPVRESFSAVMRQGVVVVPHYTMSTP